MRTFETGATRDSDETKPDYEGFLSPAVIKRFGEYMSKHRVQADGNLRASDNWQKGIPRDAYMKSAWRHFVAAWTSHRERLGYNEIEEELCALLFNIQGYLHEHLKLKAQSEAAARRLDEMAREDAQAADPIATMAEGCERPPRPLTPHEQDMAREMARAARVHYRGVE